MPSITITAAGESAVITYGSTLFGADPGTRGSESTSRALARLDTAMGPLQVVRLYDAGKGAANMLYIAQTANVLGRNPILSFKYDTTSVVAGTHDADITSLFKAMTSGYWCFYHEPDQVGRPFTAAQYVAAWQHIHALAVKSATRARACLILTGFQLATRLPTWYPGDAYVDVIAVDPYSHSTTDTAQSLFGPLLDVIGKTGKPAAIAECGCTYTDPTAVTSYIRSFAWLRGRVEFVSWFNTTAAGVDFQIDAIPAAAAAYAALCKE